METWYGVFAPAGTPAAAIAKLNADFNALLQDAQMREFLAKQGMTPAGGPPERLGGAGPKSELARWTRVVNARGHKGGLMERTCSKTWSPRTASSPSTA